MNYQILWLVLLIAFAGIEGITAGLVSIWFCAGSLVALIATWLGASLPVQIGLFAVVSVAAMALIRPMARKWLHPKMEKTNADRILGQEGVVVESIDNLSASGQVKIDGAVWTARSAGDESNPTDPVIRIKALEAFQAAANGKATKIIIPSEIQGLAGLAEGIVETVRRPDTGRAAPGPGGPKA